MSAELLREAAALMRKRAEAATPGPWGMDSNDCCVGAVDRKDATFWVLGERTGAPIANMHHAASWHPTVALAVADWLDAEADTGEQLRDVLREVEGRDDLNWEYGGLGKALAVARAYLGRDA